MFQKLLGPLDCRLMNIPLKKSRECPGSPGVRTQHFDCSGLGSISAWGTKIPLPLERSRHTTTKTAQPKKKSEPKGKFWTLGNDDASL